MKYVIYSPQRKSLLLAARRVDVLWTESFDAAQKFRTRHAAYAWAGRFRHRVAHMSLLDAVVVSENSEKLGSLRLLNAAREREARLPSVQRAIAAVATPTAAAADQPKVE